MSERRAVYLDHSASTPTDPRVVEAMLPYFTEVYGNASSVHSFGRKAEQAVEDARETVARILNCKCQEIVFTSGGSESDNLAIRGAAWSLTGRQRGLQLITTPVEHSAVSETIKQLAGAQGFNQTVLPVDSFGLIGLEDFAAACSPDTVIASVIYANNEVGSIQPISTLATRARRQGTLFHTDAVQAGGQLTLDVEALGVDLLSLSAHKFYGPKGVGVLYVREGIDLLPSQSGGSHERGRRAGTHNTPFVVGLARALELAYENVHEYTAHYQRMRDQLIDGVLDQVPNAQLSGHPEKRLPSHASFTFDGIDGNMLLMHLDMKGIAASSGSACKTGNPEPSDVLLAMGYTCEQALSSLRLTVGRNTSEADIEYTVTVLAEVIEKLYRMKTV